MLSEAELQAWRYPWSGPQSGSWGAMAWNNTQSPQQIKTPNPVARERSQRHRPTTAKFVQLNVRLVARLNDARLLGTLLPSEPVEIDALQCWFELPTRFSDQILNTPASDNRSSAPTALCELRLDELAVWIQEDLKKI